MTLSVESYIFKNINKHFNIVYSIISDGNAPYNLQLTLYIPLPFNIQMGHQCHDY